MSIFVLLGIAIGLAMDAFAVAIACSASLQPISGRQVFRFAFHFGLFQALMPVLGWLAGLTIEQFIEHWDHWIAFALLTFVGGKAIHGATDDKTGPVRSSDPTRGVTLVILSIATSIDALAVGLSLAMIKVEIWYAAITIGLVTLTMTTIGMILGNRIGRGFSKGMEIAGGLVLIGIGINILVTHGTFGFLSALD